MAPNVIYNSDMCIITAGRVIIFRQIVSPVWCRVGFIKMNRGIVRIERKHCGIFHWSNLARFVTVFIPNG